MTSECGLCYSARRWLSVALSGLSRNDFKGKRCSANLTIPCSLGTINCTGGLSHSFHVSWCLFCFAYVSMFIMCPLLDLNTRWGTNLPHITLAGALPPLSPPWRVPPEGGVSKALWGSHKAAKGQDPRCGFLVATGGCVWHVGAVAPLGATCHCDTIPPPNVTLWLCYSQLNYSIMTSLLSPNSPNYSLEIYYLIW